MTLEHSEKSVMQRPVSHANVVDHIATTDVQTHDRLIIIIADRKSEIEFRFLQTMIAAWQFALHTIIFY
jgi:hypothetical protein